MVDVFTVVAQIVNFLILVLLLKRFLYKPVLKAIEARRFRIESEVREAENLRIDAERIRSEFELKTQEFENQRQALLDDALKEVEQVRLQRLAEIQKETDIYRNQLLRSFDEQKKIINNKISRQAQEEVLIITAKVFSDLASKELEDYIVDEFLRNFQSSGPVNGESGNGEVKSISGSPIVVRTAFELNPQHQRRFAEVIRRKWEHAHTTVEFETEKNLVCGVELQIGEYKLDWNLSSYLNALSQKLNDANRVS